MANWERHGWPGGQRELDDRLITEEMEHVFLFFPLSFCSVQRTHAVVCLEPYNVLMGHLRTTHFLQKLKEFIVLMVWIHCVSENV